MLFSNNLKAHEVLKPDFFPCSWRKYSRDIHDHMTSYSLIASTLQRKQSSYLSGIEGFKNYSWKEHYILSGAAPKKQPPSYKQVPFWRKELSHLGCTYPSLNLGICSWGKREKCWHPAFPRKEALWLGERVLFPWLPWSRMEFLSFWAGGGMSWFTSHILLLFLLSFFLGCVCCVLLDFNDFLNISFGLLKK